MWFPERKLSYRSSPVQGGTDDNLVRVAKRPPYRLESIEHGSNSGE